MDAIPTLATTTDSGPGLRRDSPLTNGRPWKRFRNGLHRRRSQEAAAENRSMCGDCWSDGKAFGPLLVDAHHIVPKESRPDLLRDPCNIEFVCKRHHRMRNNWELVSHVDSRYVIYGPPGSGKTTYARTHASADAMVWDLDEHSQHAYPRTEQDMHTIRAKRTEFIRQARATGREVWMIYRWPQHAWNAAARINAGNLVRICVRSDDTRQIDFVGNDLMAQSN